MACELCRRTSCTRCFHSLKEQEEFDTKTGRYAPDDEPLNLGTAMCKIIDSLGTPADPSGDDTEGA